MSNAARKARKRAQIKFVRTPKVRTVAFTSRTHRQQQLREANAKRKAEIAARFNKNPLGRLGEALRSLPKAGAR